MDIKTRILTRFEDSYVEAVARLAEDVASSDRLFKKLRKRLNYFGSPVRVVRFSDLLEIKTETKERALDDVKDILKKLGMDSDDILKVEWRFRHRNHLYDEDHQPVVFVPYVTSDQN